MVAIGTLLFIPLVALRPKLAIGSLLVLLTVLFRHFEDTWIADLGSIRIHNIDAVAAGITLLLALAVLAGYPVVKSRSAALAMALLGVAALSVVVSFPFYGPTALKAVRADILPILLFPALALVVRSTKDATGMVRVIMAAIVAMAVFEFINYYFLDGFESRERFRFDSRAYARFLYAWQAMLVGYLLIFAAAARYLGLGRRIIGNRMVEVGIIGGCVVVIAVTQHRSVWFATLVGLAVIGYFSARNGVSRSHAIELTLTAMLIIGGGLIVASRPDSEVLAQAQQNLAFFGGAANDSTAQFRVDAWLQYVDFATRTNPVFGTGFGREISWVTNGVERTESAHSLYVMIYFRMGLLGLGLLLATFMAFARELSQFTLEAISRRAAEETFIGIAVMGCFVMTLVYSLFYGAEIQLWAIMGIAAGVRSSAETASEARRYVAA